MKTIIFSLILLPFMAFSQQKTFDNKFIFACGTNFLAGIADANLNILHFSYQKFEKKFPGASDKWDPSLTCNNKYKNNDPSQGEKFPGSTTIFVFTTDRWQALQFARDLCFTTTFYLDLRDFKGEKWYMSLLKAGIQTLSFTAGKELTFQFYDH